MPKPDYIKMLDAARTDAVAVLRMMADALEKNPSRCQSFAMESSADAPVFRRTVIDVKLDDGHEASIEIRGITKP